MEHSNIIRVRQSYPAKNSLTGAGGRDSIIVEIG